MKNKNIPKKKNPNAYIKENIGSGGITWSSSNCKCE